MPGVHKPASDSRDIYARCAETCLRFRAHLCPVCRNPPQIQGTFMPGVHCLPPDLRLIFQKSAKHKIRVIRVILNLSLGPGPGDRFLPDYDAVFGFQVGLVGGPDAEEGVPVVEHHHIAVYAQVIGIIPVPVITPNGS